MMRAKPQFDHNIHSFQTYNPPVYLYHGCPTRFCHRVLGEGRVLRGDRTIDGKYGICAFVEWLRALDYAQVAGDWAVIFKLAAWASKSTHMKGALLLREPWCELVSLIMVDANTWVPNTTCWKHDDIVLPACKEPTPNLKAMASWDPITFDW